MSKSARDFLESADSRMPTTPSHRPALNAPLLSNHAAADGQKNSSGNTITATTTIQRTGAKRSRRYTAARISPLDTRRIARGKPSSIGNAIRAVTNSPTRKPSDVQSSADQPCAFTMRPSAKQNRSAMIVCTCSGLTRYRASPANPDLKGQPSVWLSGKSTKKFAKNFTAQSKKIINTLSVPLHSSRG